MGIRCCKNCIPPKRHTACWGSCPEYIAETKAHAVAAEAKKRVDAQRGYYIETSNRLQKYWRRHGRIRGAQ